MCVSLCGSVWREETVCQSLSRWVRVERRDRVSVCLGELGWREETVCVSLCLGG